MLVALGIIATLGVGAPKPQPMDHLRLYRELRGTAARVSVWMDRSSPYTRGDRARVYIQADRDAYLTVLRIDTDGRVRVLFPQDPWDDNYVPGGRTFEVEDRDGGRAFRVDDAPGAGYVFAIAADDKFDYSSVLTQRDHWDYRAIADGQVRGDPYVAVTELAERIVPAGDYDYDLAQYDVDRHYDYPRFVCYDCHAYAPYYTWNPYAHSCVRFRVVIYDDPYYYPYRYYGGRRVVVVRPRRPQPRYVFVDNSRGRDYVTRIPTRPRREEGAGGGGGDEQMRPRRSEDVGGRGTIPVPGDSRRRTERQPEQRPSDPGQAQPERRRIEPRTEKPESRQPETRQPERRERPRTDPVPPGLNPQLRPPEETRRQKPERRMEPQKEPERRAEPQREPERRTEPQREPERRAEPRREPERRSDPPKEPERRAEPRRDPPSNNGGGRSSSPELRRRRG
jgi:uncharacterized protein DUF4384